jgi:hypothetical protein
MTEIFSFFTGSLPFEVVTESPELLAVSFAVETEPPQAASVKHKHIININANNLFISIHSPMNKLNEIS